MEQNENSSNQNQSFFEKNQVTVLTIVGVIIIGAIIFFSTRGDQNQNQTADQNQTVTENTDQNQGDQNQNNGNQNNQENNTSGSVGNVTATGTLRTSDNALRGNLMVESTSGKIYIKTVRDFSQLVDKQVTLQADGTINNFVFLGFAEAPRSGQVAGSDTDSDRNVSFTGTLNKSDSTRGNYTVSSGNTTVYLKSAHDYSSLVGSQVNLSASGSLSSFTNAVVIKA